MIPLLATLFLTPGTHHVAAPSPVSIPLAGLSYLHLRWKSDKASGYWTPPTLNLPAPGAYWISAATKPVIRAYKPADFELLLRQEGVTMIQQYRRQYKLTGVPAKILASDFAKTLVEVGPSPAIAATTLNLPVELILLHPQLVQLNFRGQPIYDIQINIDGRPFGRTNGAGQLPLPSLTRPVKLSATVARTYPDHSTADWEFFTATLTLPALNERQAAVDNRQLPGHKRRGAQKEDNGVGDVVARAESPGRRLRLQRPHWIGVGLVKGNGPWGDAIDADLRSPSSRHRAAHVDHAGLGGAIVNKHRPSLNSTDRRNIDDPSSALLLHHPPRGLLRAKEVSLQVRRMDKVPIFLCD